MMENMSPGELLGDDGPFARSIRGFAPRYAQQRMSEVVQAALHTHSTLVVEAGTGVGKTFAYLVPALLSGRKVIVSTGTRHLQDQLFHRDLPVVQNSMGLSVSTALLKGRGNYLCLYRLHKAEGEMADMAQSHQLQVIKQWSRTTMDGDIAGLAEVPESAPVWAKATSTTDNCLGSECPDFNNCHLVKARRRAQEADVVVVNHHLFFADMALKDEGFGEVLPSADAFILDEAHQLPDTATQFFGQSVSSRQLDDLAADCLAAQLREAPDMPALRDSVHPLQTAVKRFRLALGQYHEQRIAWRAAATQAVARSEMDSLCKALEYLREALSEIAGRGELLEQCEKRCALLRERLELFNSDETATVERILWLETRRAGFSLHATPTEVGELFRQYMQTFHAAWVFTSATLTVAGRFEHFLERMGVSEAETVMLESPFDYARNALLYLPPAMPDPNDAAFSDRLIEVSLPILTASGGRAFMLFTSYRALDHAASALAGRVNYPLFVQGEMPRSQLLDKFRLSGNGILLGTSSFWEGVDIRGEALSCVIIDKLPFAAPNDPVLQARLALIRERGGNPFADYQIPQAVITLKQGIGRLIRDVHDRGVLMIADPRLLNRGYGKIFLSSLPEMTVTTDIDDVERFFA
jgi:ATP-dependent DNA helicase DinG